MNRTKIFGIFLAFVISVFLPSLSSLVAISTEVDQSYKPYPPYGVYNISSNSPLGQVFTPTKGSLTSLQIVIDTSASGSHNFTATITRGGSNIGQTSTTQALTPGSKTITFEFSPSVSLQKSVEYTVYISTSDTNSGWAYGESGSGGSYSRGYAVIGGMNSDQIDLHFATFGPVEVQEEKTEPEKEDTNEEEDTSGIGVPENLEVLNKGSDFVKLTWDGLDDENIKGYKVLYGTIPTDLDEEVDVGNDTSYTIRGLEADTLYYFAISAYDQDREEGKKSAILQTRTDKSSKKMDSLDIWWYIARIASVLILILAAFLGYRWFRKKKLKKDGKDKEQPKEKSSIDKEEEIPVRKDNLKGKDRIEEGDKRKDKSSHS